MLGWGIMLQVRIRRSAEHVSERKDITSDPTEEEGGKPRNRRQCAGNAKEAEAARAQEDP